MASEIEQPADIPTLSDHALPNPARSSGDPEQQPSSNNSSIRPRPPSKAHRRRRRRESSDSHQTNCRDCCYLWCLLTVIMGSISISLFYLILQPKNFKYHITKAELVQFDLNTTTNTLYYDLSLNLTIQNPNKFIETDYILPEARGYYEDQWFAALMLPGFHQETKNTTVLNIVFRGHHMVVLQDSRQLQAYYSDKALGIYSIVIKLNYRRKEYWRGDPQDEIKTTIVCKLKVPLESGDHSSGKASNATFQTTKCQAGTGSWSRIKKDDERNGFLIFSKNLADRFHFLE